MATKSVVPSAELSTRALKIKRDSPARMALRRFMYNKLAVAGAVVLLLMILMSICAPLLTHYSPTQINLMNADNPPGPGHWLGTSEAGIDNWTLDVYGGRADLMIGFGCTLVLLVIGVIIGGIAGYYGGWVDGVLMRICDFMMNFPVLLLIIVITAVINAESVWILIGVIGFVSWPGFSRYVRGLLLNLRETEYVLAAQISGTSSWRIIFRHMLPNAIGPLVVMMSFVLSGNVGIEAGLALVGFGVPPSTPSWGNMMSQAMDFVQLQTEPWAWGPPMLFLTLTILSINFIGDGLRDAFDQDMKM